MAISEVTEAEMDSKLEREVLSKADLHQRKLFCLRIQLALFRGKVPVTS